MEEILLEGHISPADREANEFPLLPFEIPPGVHRFHIRYQVTHQLDGSKAGWQEGNIVDIGLFDPRGADFLAAPGFRGWSGTMRREISIADDEATPGYLPGPIQPGTWHVLLGLYQLASQGCDYQVTIAPDEGDAKVGPQEVGSIGTPPAVGSPRWYRGDLHAHTWHSDGTAPLSALVAAARAQGLDFVAITEHNTISHLPLLPDHTTRELLLIPGVEVSTYHGHANVWPADGFVEFRCQNDGQMEQVREMVRERGALFSVNHPKEGGPPWTFGSLFEPDCIEVWGGPWIVSNYQSLAAWDAQLRRGKRITAVGGSDKHQGPFAGELGWYEVGTPCTWVHADILSTEALITGLRAGHVSISEQPNGPTLEMTARARDQQAMIGDELHLPPGTSVSIRCHVQGGAGSLLRIISSQETHTVEIPADDFDTEHTAPANDDSYWRAEVIEPPEAPLDEEPAALMVRALSNPIYVTVCR